MAIAYDAGSDKGAGGSSSISNSHTITGSDTILFAGILTGAGTISTITYNGVDMKTNSIGSAQDTDGTNDLWAYYLVAPATGTNTLASTRSSSTNSYRLAGASFTGADQTTPTGVTNQTRLNSVTSYSPTVTTTVDDAWVVNYGRNTISANTAGADTVLCADTGTNPYLGRSDADTGPAGSHSLNYTMSSGDVGYIVWDLNPAGGGGATFTPIVSMIT